MGRLIFCGVVVVLDGRVVGLVRGGAGRAAVGLSFFCRLF